MRSTIRDLREQLSISVQELADRVGITKQTMAKYEEDSSVIPVWCLRKLSLLLGVDYTSIIENTLPIEESVKKDNVQRYLERKASISDLSKEKERALAAFERNGECEPRIVDTDEEYYKALAQYRYLADKFITVFLYILTELGSKPVVGRSWIGKLMYFMQYDYINEHKGQYFFYNNFTREYCGPVPLAFDETIEHFVEDGLIEYMITKSFHHNSAKYFAKVKPDLSCLTTEDIKFVKKEMKKYNNFTHDEFNALLEANWPFRNTEVTPNPSIIEFKYYIKKKFLENKK